MSLPWSSKGVKTTPIGADELMIIDSADANPSTQNKRIAISTLPIESLLTTKGDLIGFDTANARIPIGADNLALIADSATLLGLKWANPQTPILQNIDYSGFNIENTSSLLFNEITEPATPSVGKVIEWAEDIGDLSIMKYKGNDGVVQNILESDILVVRNDTGGTLFKGDAVYVDGESGETISVQLAKADSGSTLPALGVVQQDISNGVDGFVLVSGTLIDLNTTGFTVGDLVYVSATVAGELTSTPPSHPNIQQLMGTILKVDATTGRLGVFTGGIFGVETGTNQNSFLIGDGLVGTKSLGFTNDFTGLLEMNPTANRTVNIQDIDHTIAGIDISNSWASGIRQTFTPDGTTPGLNFGSQLGDPSTPTDGDVWYNATTNKFRGRQNGLNFNIISDQTPWASNIDAAGFNLFNLAYMESNATTPATLGAVRLGNLESLAWRDFGDSTDLTITLSASDEFEINAPVNLLSNNLTLGAAYMDLGEIATPIAPAGATGRVYTKDVSGDTHLFIQDDTTETDLNLSVQTPWASDIDGATFNLLNSGYLEQNEITEPADPAAGKLRLWSISESDFSFLQYKGNNGFVNTISQDVFAAVRNTTGGTLTKGQAVYATGASGQRITVDLARSDVSATMPAIGFILEDIANNSNGFVIVAGTERDLNTNAFSAGDLLYVSDTVAGDVVTTKPSHPSIGQLMGIVLVSSPTVGEVTVIPGNPSGTEEGTNSNSFLIGDGLVGTKEIQMVNDFTQILSFNPTNNHTLTFPDATDTIVGRDTFDTLTNKIISGASNTLTGATDITGLGIQVQDLPMADNNIIFDTITGGQIATLATQKIAFYGNTPIVQPIDGATLTNNVTVGGTTDQIDDFTDLSVYATDAATIRNDIYQLARKVKIITDNLRALGLES